MNYKFLTTSLLITTFLTGCATFNTAPKGAWNKKKENKDLLDFVEKNHLEKYLDKQTNKREYLTKLATAKIYLIDDAYSEFKNKLKKHKGLTFGSSATSQMFSAAATLFTPNSTKTLLSAGATSVSGLQSSFDKHMLAEKSIEAILNQMDAQRAIVFKSIRESLNDPNYTLIDLNRHLDLYADAGTIEAAMREITNTTASNNVAAQNLIISSGSYKASNTAESLRSWLNKDREKHLKILSEWLQANAQIYINEIRTDRNGFDATFLNTGKYEELRLKFVKQHSL